MTIRPANDEAAVWMKEHLQADADWVYRKVLRHPLLPRFLETSGICDQSVQVGWGYRPSGRAAIRTAEKSGARLLILEDSFVRSLRPGKQGLAYGLVADSQGIHYDLHGKSDLLELLNTGNASGWIRDSSEDPVALMEKFRNLRASKYNWFPGEFREEKLPDEQGILVVDQTRGDAALRFGDLGTADFDQMLRAALEHSERTPIYVRAHPDHLFRAKRSCFSASVLADSRVHLLSSALSPAQCFSFCHTVMVGSSLMGMEALIFGKKVITYGWPFFAGWGLTEDRNASRFEKRARVVELPALFEAAYLRYGHYFDPDTRERCGLGAILDHLALQKEMFHKNAGTSVTVGFSPWQRSVASHYLRSPAGSLTRVATIAQARETLGPKPGKMLFWGRRSEAPSDPTSSVFRIEDGFIRSKGLGAAFNFPYSWVLDSTGIYFDATAPSDLEEILNQPCSPVDLIESEALIDLLREKRLTKYNLTRNSISLDAEQTVGKKIILVPGQVEVDASIAFGSPVLKSNIELLRAVREAEPDAFIIFKAHPDLVAGARHGSVLPSGYDGLSDLAVTKGNVLDWLDVCHEVHTMTSTVGFEALIRQVPVVTYGMPFYAGWGLTTDRLGNSRRNRALTLAELVCGALIKYPRYLNPATGEFTTALKVARLLTSESLARDSRAWYLKTVSKLKKLWVEWAR